jgi:hypothetical protein
MPYFFFYFFTIQNDRDPTSLESISSGISRLSGYVTSNLPKRRQSAPVEHYAPFIQDEPVEKEEDHEEPTDTITFATFSKLNIQNDTRYLSCILRKKKGGGLHLYNFVKYVL